MGIDMLRTKITNQIEMRSRNGRGGILLCSGFYASKDWEHLQNEQGRRVVESESY